MSQTLEAVPSTATGPSAGTIPERGAGWEETLGATWRLDLALFLGVLAFVGLLTPLFDPDLPMHLVIGEWVVEHGRVPFVEPFAWTRAGEPYYAYSWLPQVGFHLAYDALGSAGLRLLQALLYALMAGAMLVAARWMGLRPATALAMATLNAFFGLLVARGLRPQMVLLITVPLIWGLVALMLRRRSWVGAGIGLVLCSAVAANSHLFFPITLAQLALGLTEPEIRWRRLLVAAGCIVAGWLVSPYALVWLDVYRLNFTPNALVRWPPIVTELIPGFLSMTGSHRQMAVPAICLALLPWMLMGAQLSGRQRAIGAVVWLPGLLAFGLAQRLLLAWWLLAILPVAWALSRVGDTERRPAAPRLPAKLPAYVLAVIVMVGVALKEAASWRLDGGDGRRRLATVNSFAADHLAVWLLESTHPGATGRLHTNFNLGSYLTWRLPGISSSIDSRGIFPDSVAAANAFIFANQARTPLGPWRSADLAILPLRERVAGVLDTASGWRRIAAFRSDSVPADSAALWVRFDWWARHGRRPLPATTVELTYEPSPAR